MTDGRSRRGARRGGRALVSALLAAAALAAGLGAWAPGAVAQDHRSIDRAIRTALGQGDNNALEAAVRQARQVGGRQVASLLLRYAGRVPPGAEESYWRLVNGAAMLRDEEGLSVVADQIVGRQRGLARDLMFSMQNNHAQAVPGTVHALVLQRGDDDLKLMAIDQLVAIETVEAVDVLIEGLGQLERRGAPQVVEQLVHALRHLTRADMASHRDWENWWETARADGLAGRERRSGRGTVVAQLDRTAYEAVEALRELDERAILVFEASCPHRRGGCTNDDIGKVLRAMGVPYTPFDRDKFNAGELEIENAMAIFMNCVRLQRHCTGEECTQAARLCPQCDYRGNDRTCPECEVETQEARMVGRGQLCGGPGPHDRIEHKLTGESVERIKRWVEREGGYLFSQDLGLIDVLERAWPRHVRAEQERGNPVSLSEKTVAITPGRGTTAHPLLRGVFLDPAEARRSAAGGTVARDGQSASERGFRRDWKIDDESPLIRITGEVTVLMESDDLAKKGSAENRGVALTFFPVGGPGSEQSSTLARHDRMRGGRVLHVLSHFGKQETDEDEFALQAMLLNFLIEAHRRSTRR